MYLPKHFEVGDAAALHELVRVHPLATWVVQHAGELLVNHVPMLLDAGRGGHGTLQCHVARANPVWRAVAAGAQAVAIFHGPQAYVSPNWYPSKAEHGKAVPTWNYAVVHAHGRPAVIDDRARLLDLVTRLTEVHESGLPQPWRVGDAPVDYLDSMLAAIVMIEMPVARWVGKVKASQNRSTPDRLGVADALAARATPESQAMATLVREGRHA